MWHHGWHVDGVNVHATTLEPQCDVCTRWKCSRKTLVWGASVYRNPAVQKFIKNSFLEIDKNCWKTLFLRQVTQSKAQGMITGDSTKIPRFGFKASKSSKARATCPFPSLTSTHFFIAVALRWARRAQGSPPRADLRTSRHARPACHWKIGTPEPNARVSRTPWRFSHFSISPLLIIASSVLDCLLMSMLGPECRNWYGTMFLIDKASAAFRNSVPNSKSPKGHRLWSFATLFRSGRSCLIQPSHSQAKRSLSSQAPDFVRVVSFLRTHDLQRLQVQFVELYQLARPQVRLQSQKEGDCHKPVLLPCELVRHGLPDWQRIRPARLRWAQAPPSTQASPLSGCGSAPCLVELRNLWHQLAMSHSPTWACSRAKNSRSWYPTRSCTRRARRPPRRPRRVVFLCFWPTPWTPAFSVCRVQLTSAGQPVAPRNTVQVWDLRELQSVVAISVLFGCSHANCGFSGVSEPEDVVLVPCDRGLFRLLWVSPSTAVTFSRFQIGIKAVSFLLSKRTLEIRGSFLVFLISVIGAGTAVLVTTRWRTSTLTIRRENFCILSLWDHRASERRRWWPLTRELQWTWWGARAVAHKPCGCSPRVSSPLDGSSLVLNSLGTHRTLNETPKASVRPAMILKIPSNLNFRARLRPTERCSVTDGHLCWIKVSVGSNDEPPPVGKGPDQQKLVSVKPRHHDKPPRYDHQSSAAGRLVAQFSNRTNTSAPCQVAHLNDPAPAFTDQYTNHEPKKKKQKSNRGEPHPEFGLGSDWTHVMTFRRCWTRELTEKTKKHTTGRVSCLVCECPGGFLDQSTTEHREKRRPVKHPTNSIHKIWIEPSEAIIKHQLRTNSTM